MSVTVAQAECDRLSGADRRGDAAKGGRRKQRRKTARFGTKFHGGPASKARAGEREECVARDGAPKRSDASEGRGSDILISSGQGEGQSLARDD